MSGKRRVMFTKELFAHGVKLVSYFILNSVSGLYITTDTKEVEEAKRDGYEVIEFSKVIISDSGNYVRIELYRQDDKISTIIYIRPEYEQLDLDFKEGEK